jgi:hypothetical protein
MELAWASVSLMIQEVSMTPSTHLAEEEGAASTIETCMGREGLM